MHLGAVEKRVVGFAARLALGLFGRATTISTVVSLCQTAKAIVVVGDGGGALRDQHSLKNVAIIKAMTGVFLADGASSNGRSV